MTFSTGWNGGGDDAIAGIDGTAHDRAVERQIPLRSCAALLAAALLASGHSGAPPAAAAPASLHAVVTNVEHPGDLEDCPTETVKLAVLEGRRELRSELLCSSYGVASAELISDARGRHYVRFNYGEGRGTRAVTWYIRLYEFIDGQLVERGRLPRSEPIGFYANRDYDYVVSTPGSGGVTFAGTPHIVGELEARDARPPMRPMTLSLDTAIVPER